MFDLSKFTDLPIVGAVKVNKPYTIHYNSYECAAWWEDREAQVGVYPITLSRAPNFPNLLTLTAKIKAKVIADYFPGLWGGVAISNKPYEYKHLGESRTIHRGIDILDAVQQTGDTPDSALSWFVHPSWWKVFAEEAEFELKHAYQRLPACYDEWKSLDKATFKPRLEGRFTFDMEYQSKLSSISHCANQINEWAKKLERIDWHSQYHVEGGRNNSVYNQANYSRNTEWRWVIPIQVNE